MAKSKVQFQKGYSLFDFFKDYGTEAQCENALLAWRFPNGFICPECANKTCCRLKSRPRVLQCNNCRHQMSLTGKNDFCKHQTPTDQVVSGDAAAVTDQNWLVSDGAKAPVGRQI